MTNHIRFLETLKILIKTDTPGAAAATMDAAFNLSAICVPRNTKANPRAILQAANDFYNFQTNGDPKPEWVVFKEL